MFKSILNTQIPINKNLWISLTYVYGLGNSKALFIIKKLGFSKNFKTSDLTNSQILELQIFMENSNIKTNINLKNFQAQYLNKLKSKLKRNF